MKRVGKLVKKMIYKVCPIKTYLRVLSKIYFISYSLGLLKWNKQYKYHYFLKDIIQKGDVCIDLGANLGYFTVVLSKLVGHTGQIYAIEPIRPILEVLRDNTLKLTNIKILPIALGAENKAIQLVNTTPKNFGFMATGRNSIASRVCDSDLVFDAKMKKGSELFTDLEKLDFIKCDIEGYEVIVLHELEDLIIKHRPIVLVEATGSNRKNLLQFFKRRQFENYTLEDGYLVPALPSDFCDMLSIPIEKQTSILHLLKNKNTGFRKYSLALRQLFVLKFSNYYKS